jgi:hypothetical protein
MAIETKILDRVKKMLALGNDAAASEGERETALRMAYNLLAKHNLSLSDIPAEQVGELRERQDIIVSADKWARSLAHSVAKLFFCKYFYIRTQTSGKDKHCFVGRQSNVLTATYMTEYLIKSVKREAAKRYKSVTSPEGRSFCVGTVSAIRARVDEMLERGTEETVSNALVLINVHKAEDLANNSWLENVGMKLTVGKARADNSLVGGAFYDGKAFGKTVSLVQQVGTASRSNLKQLGV